MRASLLVPMALLFASCGWKGDQVFCGGDGDCPQGYRCENPGSKYSEGICVAGWQVELDASTLGSVMGPGEAQVSATLIVGAESLVAPETMDLMVDGQPSGSLTKGEQSGLSVGYEGTFVPPARIDGTVEMVAVVRRGTINEASSEPRLVDFDTVGPQIGEVAVACGDATPCLRDSEITVTATATDRNQGTAAVTLDIDESQAQAMTVAGGTSYSATVKLAEWSFPFMEHAVVVTVEATDALGNRSESTESIEVTRRRWVYEPEGLLGSPPVTSPAVMPPGDILVVGLDAAGPTEQLRGVNVATGEQQWAVQLSTSGRRVPSAPSVGLNGTVWVGTEDGHLYAATSAGVVSECTGTATAPLTVRTPVVSGQVGYSATGQRLLGLQSLGVAFDCKSTTARRVVGAMAMSDAKFVFAPMTVSGADGVVEIYQPGSLAPAELEGVTPTFQFPTGQSTQAPVAIELLGSAIAASGDGTLYRVSKSGSWSVAPVGTVDLPGVPQSLAIADGGDIVVGTHGGEVYRLTAEGVEVWHVTLDSAASVTGLALAASDAEESGISLGAVVYATTSEGDLFALDQSGGTVWSTQGLATNPLGEESLDFPLIGGSPGYGRLPALYTGSKGGQLYAIIVDTDLDETAPWPLAHQDARNSGNAGE